MNPTEISQGANKPNDVDAFKKLRAYTSDLQEKHAKACATLKVLHGVLDNSKFTTPSIGTHSVTSIMKSIRHTLKEIGHPIAEDMDS